MPNTITKTPVVEPPTLSPKKPSRRSWASIASTSSSRSTTTSRPPVRHIPLPYPTSLYTEIRSKDPSAYTDRCRQEHVGNRRFVPTETNRSGPWTKFVDHQKTTLAKQNRSERHGLFTKTRSTVIPLFNNIQTLCFGDSFIRLFEPAMPSMYVLSYPGIPVKSLDRAIVDGVPVDTISRTHDQWLVSPPPSRKAHYKRKMYLSISHPLDTHQPVKSMFYNFTDTMKTPPRVDILRQIVRFPMDQIHQLVFWFGNAELNIVFYYDFLSSLPHREDMKTYYPAFRDAFVKKSVASYIRFLQVVTKLHPKALIVIILVNDPVIQSPFHFYRMLENRFEQDHVTSVLPRSKSCKDQLIHEILAYHRRYEVIHQWNELLIDHLQHSELLSSHVQWIDVNPLILDPKTHRVKTIFQINPFDIHLQDPQHVLYENILHQLHHFKRRDS